MERIKAFVMPALLAAGITACTGGGGKNAGDQPSPSLVSIVVAPSNPSIALGKTQQFTATGTYSNNSTKDLSTSATWSTSNAAIVTISSAGLASMVSAGTATITATCESRSGTATLTVGAPESPFALHEVRFSIPQEATAIVDLGATTARIAPYGALIWDMIEKQKGVYDWTASDLVLTAGYGTGTKLFVSVGAQNSLEGTAPDAGQLPKDLDWYLDFLKKAVERYDGDGIDDAPGSPKIDVVQIGNEVDGPFWQDTPENYALLLKESYKAIKGVAPDIKVAIAGVATPWGFETFYRPILAELDRLKDAPGDRYFDIFDLHWSGQFPGDNDYAAITLDKTYELGAYIANINAELAAIGYDTIPVYITEMSDYSDAPAGYANHTERYHAAAVVKRFLYALSRGAAKIFWSEIVEQHNFGGVANGYFDNVGLINNPLNSDGLSHKKLAYYTYKKMVEMLEGGDWKDIQIVSEAGDMRVFKLGRNGKPIYVAWWDGYTAGTTTSVAISGLGGTTAIVTDSIPKVGTGAEVADYMTAFPSESLMISNGTVTISLNDDPVFVEVVQ